MNAKILRVSQSLDGYGEVLVRVPLSSLQKLQDLMDQDCDMEIKKHRNHRSLDANAYAWALIGEIADSLRASKEEIYLKMLKEYGQSEYVSVLSKIEVKYYFKYYEEKGKGIVNGNEFTHYLVYKGSSDFDSREMAIFIDGIISEARQLGIETRTPAEIANMKSLWENLR